MGNQAVGTILTRSFDPLPRIIVRNKSNTPEPYTWFNLMESRYEHLTHGSGKHDLVAVWTDGPRVFAPGRLAGTKQHDLM